jgi:hypothetical protein
MSEPSDCIEPFYYIEPSCKLLDYIEPSIEPSDYVEPSCKPSEPQGSHKRAG